VGNFYKLLHVYRVVIVYSQINSKDIEMDHKEGDYCSVNVNSVDMYKYPSLQDIPWWSAEIKAGDCIYVPYGYVKH
jgi:lysine-specific demethylase 8